MGGLCLQTDPFLKEHTTENPRQITNRQNTKWNFRKEVDKRAIWNCWCKKIDFLSCVLSPKAL